MIFKKGENSNRKEWLKKLSVAGFLFFLVKGLVWVGVAIFAWLEIKK